MNHEDSFSRIFRKAADEIEEQPSSDLWNRLEKRLDESAFSEPFREAAEQIDERPSADLWNRLSAKLDEKMPLAQKQVATGRVISLSRRWMAAASMVVMVFAAVGIITMLNRNKESMSDLAQDAPNRKELEDVVLTDANLPIAALTEKEQEARLAKADKIQAETILKDAKAANTNGDNISTVEAKVQLNDNPSAVLDDIVGIEIEQPTLQSGRSMAPRINSTGTTATSNANVYGLISNEPAVSTNPQLLRDAGNVVESNSNNRYADIVPSVSNSISYEQLQKEDDWKTLQQAERNIRKTSAVTNITAKKEIVSPSQESLKTTTKAKAADANDNRLHNSLQIFDWLVGTWKDSKQYAGVSYEEWAVKDPYTLVGKCYVINETMNSRLFQEQISIVFNKDLRQVFLITSLDDSGYTIDYMLSGYDLSAGEYTFQQSDYPQYPERVVLQRGENAASFATIIIDKHSKKNTLNAEQQRYLDNRNHVSGERAVRNMTRVNR